MSKDAFPWRSFFKALPLIIWGAVALVQVMKSEGGLSREEIGEIADGLSSLSGFGRGAGEKSSLPKLPPLPTEHQKID